MRFFTFLILPVLTLSAQTLSISSGNGQIVLEQFLSTVPMVAQATDAAGRPVAGLNVTWSITQGAGTLAGPPTGPTDVNGLAQMTFLATAVPPGISWAPVTVSASTGVSSVNFVLTTVLSRLPGGGLAAPPQGQLISPQPGGAVTGAAGSTIAGGLQVLVTALSGSQAGQPVPNVGVRIPPPSDPSLPSAACNAPGGIALTNAQGLAVCDLVLGSKTGSTQLSARIGEAQTTPAFTLQVTPGLVCTYAIAPLGPSFPVSGGTGSVNIATAAGCSWTASANVPWIAVSPASGNGPAAVSYTVMPNGGASRSGTLSIAGLSVTVTQAGTGGPQPLTIASSATLPYATLNLFYSTTLAAAGGSGQYSWTLFSSLPPGLSLSAAGLVSGVPTATGNYTFNIGVRDAVSGATQSQNFTLAVVGSAAQLLITTTSLPNGIIGQAYQQALGSTAGCSTPFSPTPVFRLIGGSLPPGLSIQQVNNYYAIAGTPTVAGAYPFVVSATDACGNTATASLTIVIGNGQTAALTVTPQSLQFSALSGSVASSTQILSLSSAIALSFSATASTANGGNWLSIANANGTTPASLAVTVANTAQLPPGNYNGSITINSAAGNGTVIVPVSLIVGAMQNVLVVTPTAISASLKNSGNTFQQQALTIGSGGAQVQFSATAATNDGAPWLSITPSMGTTPTIVTVSINAANLAPGTYGGTIVFSSASGQQAVAVGLTVISGSLLGVTQSALTFNVGLNGNVGTQTLGVTGAPGAVNFTVSASTAAGGNWLSVSPASGATPANVVVTANPAGLAAGTYSGLISIQASDPAVPPVNVPVTLNVPPSPPAIVSVTNGASFIPGAIAPGELLVIFGSQLGPQGLVSGLSTALGGTGATFDGIAAPLLYASSGQLALIVPFEVAGRVSTVLQVTYNGVLSNQVSLRLVDSSPAIFTLGPDGQGAILNQDGTVNGGGNGAAVGSVVSIFATGGGQTNPAGVDGQITGSGNLPILLGQVQVTIGGQPAQVLYAGGAPGLVSGIIQVNAQVPTGLPSGAQTVVLAVGGASSPGVSMAVQ